MAWKQPIDTELERLTQGNVFAATVFMELIRRASNSDREAYHHDIYIPLKRGECIAGRYELARRFGLKENEAGRIQRVLERLEKTYKLISKRKSKDCSVITIHNYDELTAFKQTEEQTADKH